MTFASISDRTDGQTIDETWFDIIRSEGVTLEGYVSAIKTDLVFSLGTHGFYESQAARTGLIYQRVDQDIEILTAKLFIVTAGASGSTEIDVYRKRGAGSFESLFTTTPVVPFGAGDLSDSATGAGATAAVLDSTKTLLLTDDILRFDFVLAQAAPCRGAFVRLGYRITGAQ